MNENQTIFKCCSCRNEFERNIVTISGETHICFSCVKIINNRVDRFMRSNKNQGRKLWPDGVGSMLSNYMEHDLR